MERVNSLAKICMHIDASNFVYILFMLTLLHSQSRKDGERMGTVASLTPSLTGALPSVTLMGRTRAVTACTLEVVGTRLNTVVHIGPSTTVDCLKSGGSQADDRGGDMTGDVAETTPCLTVLLLNVILTVTLRVLSDVMITVPQESLFC